MPVEGLGLGRGIPACRNTDFFPPTAYIAATTGASPRIFGRVYLSAFRRRVMTSFFEQMLKHHIFTFYGYLYPMNPGTSAFALAALLLLMLPFALTLRALLVLSTVAERSHQLLARTHKQEQPVRLLQIITLRGSQTSVHQKPVMPAAISLSH